MITILDDKKKIKSLLSDDPYIASAGITQDDIQTTRYGTDTLNYQTENFKVFIFNGQPERGRTWMQKGIVYKVAVSGKRSSSATIDSIMEQIIALLSEAEITDCHILELLDSPMEMQCDPSIYLLEVSFVCWETVFNKRRK